MIGNGQEILLTPEETTKVLRLNTIGLKNPLTSLDRLTLPRETKDGRKMPRLRPAVISGRAFFYIPEIEKFLNDMTNFERSQ